jgi:hypothetical protein
MKKENADLPGKPSMRGKPAAAPGAGAAGTGAQ